MTTCPIHHIEFTCSRCDAIARGSKGGAKRTARQSEAARAAIGKVNAAKKQDAILTAYHRGLAAAKKAKAAAKKQKKGGETQP
jgi:hypothetical protein